MPQAARGIYTGAPLFEVKHARALAEEGCEAVCVPQATSRGIYINTKPAEDNMPYGTCSLFSLSLSLTLCVSLSVDHFICTYFPDGTDKTALCLQQL